jgi:hypothetical protein
MRSPALDGWGNPVASLFSGSGKSPGLYTAVAGRLGMAVDDTHRFYQSAAGFIRGLFHYYPVLFISVTTPVLPAMHTTYNNKRLSIFNLLVINSRSQ